MSTRARILVVDDEEVIVEVICDHLLKDCGYELARAYSGVEAIAKAREFKPDCLLTGVMMANGDGIYAREEILKFLPACKIVFATGAAWQPSFRETYLSLGLDPRLLLAKPFTREELVATMEYAGFPCRRE